MEPAGIEDLHQCWFICEGGRSYNPPMGNENTSSARRDVSLRDHKRVGQRLVAPWNQSSLGSFTETSWTTERLPEVVWIGELIAHLGPNVSFDDLALLTEIGYEVGPKDSMFMPTVASSWTIASPECKTTVLEALKKRGSLVRIQSA